MLSIDRSGSMHSIKQKISNGTNWLEERRRLAAKRFLNTLLNAKPICRNKCSVQDANRIYVCMYSIDGTRMTIAIECRADKYRLLLSSV